LIVELQLVVLRTWEAWRPTLPHDVMKRTAWMTRYGRIGYREAMEMPAWERRTYCDALQELIEEEKRESGGLSADLLD